MENYEPTGLSGVQAVDTPKPINEEPLFNTGLHLINLEQAKEKFAYLEAKICKYDQDLKEELLAKRPNTGISYMERHIRSKLNFLVPMANRLEDLKKAIYYINRKLNNLQK